ncbi:Two-component response regulator 24 [Linum perenne]
MGSEDSRHNCNMIKALLVDDDTIAKLLHPKLLEKVGILDHKIASDGQEAVDLVASLGVKYFDVILMDIDMPVMNGIVATKELRDMGVRNTIVGLSSRPRTEEMVMETMESGIWDDYVVKPLTRDKIISIVEKIMDS